MYKLGPFVTVTPNFTTQGTNVDTFRILLGAEKSTHKFAATMTTALNIPQPDKPAELESKKNPQ